ncbi:pilus assembly PilX N-terminal domain-containing protein [Gallaecimonas sp. GXIMD4217]|uniref:pilus assembly PilX family protein n=1 Tax=Gallaecimonas sp. GXIMD4217 TaxID=3131927 RepID=UPI00311AC90E
MTIYERSRGFVTLTVVIILMILVIAVSVFTAKNKVMEQRIISNEVRYQQAFEAAESGLEYGIGQVRGNPQIGGMSFTLASGSVSGASHTFSVAAVEGTYAFTSPAGESLTYPVVDLTSTGQSLDGTSTQVHRQTLLIRPIVATGPAAPLTVGGSMVVGGSFSVAANPNAGGRGVPVSIWMDTPVDLSGSVKTCGQGEWDDGDCTVATYSSKDNAGIDVLDADPDFPDDLFAHVFGIPSGEWSRIKNEATQILTSCAGLTNQSYGLIVVEGPCDLKTDLGTQESPVILLVVDGDLTLNASYDFYGIIFSFHTDPAVETDFKANGTAAMNGSLVANHDVEISNGNFGVRYDELALSNIAISASFQRITRLPGSWRDW